ncbi:hypothetical protein KL86DES1_10584 [uncultured Desulfovibrio sp.]|jgi:hypothetical protein|uniref:Uncharacterized protein n=1 Tax=uncultured Desulfovibrio sp. TaxID=167968 RepID=A0A212KZM0_9BACT|nr:hypothetical protein KL86DES1_10584 [uncultured Desulfovibrio sp.]VZH32460.1 conserved protein of unknown function [Desulfovibrio sp. 86]
MPLIKDHPLCAFFYKNTHREMPAKRTSFAPTPTLQREMALVRTPPHVWVGHALKIFCNSPAATDFLAVPPQDSQ